jgi:hypothetical protein
MASIADNDFSYRLTESILSQTPNSTISSRQQTTPRLVTPLPEHAIVIQPRDSNSSFNHYIGNHFKQDAPVFLDRLDPSRVPEKKTSESTFWGYLSNDLDSKPLQQDSLSKIEKDSTWYEYDFTEHTMTYSTATHLFSAGAFFFMFGFLFPPLWWVGSFYPTHVYDESKVRYDSDIKMLKRWRTLNRFFSLGFSTLLIIALIILAILYTKT